MANYSNPELLDIKDLINNSVSENKILDYKIQLPSNTDSDKKELLADVSSFANTAGGSLIFGINEDSGIPIEIIGVETPDVDAEILRLENIIRDGLSPRISGIQIYILGVDDKKVLVIHIPKSWASPHMVTFKNSSKFFGRNSAGKYQLDVGELRSAFALSETITEKIRNFRIERLNIISASEIPVVMLNETKIVLHVIPFNAFDLRLNYDLTVLKNHNVINLRPISAEGWGSRYNFDGLIVDAKNEDRSSAYSYIQFFRNGIVEAVTEELVVIRDNKKVIPSLDFECDLIKALEDYLSALKILQVEPPFVVLLSLLNVKGCIMGVRSTFGRRDIRPIDRETLIVPDTLVESYNVSAPTIMKPLFDAVWNACGWRGSIYYDQEGNRKEQS